MSAPLAYFLTWTCYGTWLHGDPRGSVEPGHNMPGTSLLPENSTRRHEEKSRLKTPPFALDETARGVVRRAIEDHCAVRGWTLWACNVRGNHAHVVVACPPEVPPETALNQFKAWATRRLRAAGLAAPAAPVWTRHGSTRWLNDPQSLNAAVAYVLEGQDRRG